MVHHGERQPTDAFKGRSVRDLPHRAAGPTRPRAPGCAVAPHVRRGHPWRGHGPPLEQGLKRAEGSGRRDGRVGLVGGSARSLVVATHDLRPRQSQTAHPYDLAQTVSTAGSSALKPVVNRPKRVATLAVHDPHTGWVRTPRERDEQAIARALENRLPRSSSWLLVDRH